MGNTPVQRAKALIKELERHDGPPSISFVELQQRGFFRNHKEFRKLCKILRRRGRHVMRNVEEYHHENAILRRVNNWVYAASRQHECEAYWRAEYNTQRHYVNVRNALVQQLDTQRYYAQLHALQLNALQSALSTPPDTTPATDTPANCVEG